MLEGREANSREAKTSVNKSASRRDRSHGDTTHRWDADNRLIELTTPQGERWRYAYDGLGRRIRKLRVVSGGLPNTQSDQHNPGHHSCEGGTPEASLSNASTPGNRPYRGGGGNGERIVVGEQYLWSFDQLIEAAPIYADGTA